MAKKQQGWQKGEGGFSKSSDLKITRVPAPDASMAGQKKGIDWSKTVDADTESTHNAGGGRLIKPPSVNK